MSDYIEDGYFLMARKIVRSGSWLMDKPPLYWKLWAWMLGRANWKERDKLKRGQFVTSIAEMQEAMSWKAGWRKFTPTKDEIRSAYEAFAKATMITTTKTTRGMIVTIQNYDYYQDAKNYEAHNEAHYENAMKSTATPHDTEEGFKKGGKKKKEKSYNPTGEGAEFSSFNPPDWVPRQEWDAWLCIRRKRRVSVDAASLQYAVEELDRLRLNGDSPNEVLRQSIVGEYPSVYPVKRSHEERENIISMRERKKIFAGAR